MQIVSTEYKFHIPVVPADLLDNILLLHHTAAQGDHHAGILPAVYRQRTETSIDTDIGIFPDGAGVVEDKIRIL